MGRKEIKILVVKSEDENIYKFQSPGEKFNMVKSTEKAESFKINRT